MGEDPKDSFGPGGLVGVVSEAFRVNIGAEGTDDVGDFSAVGFFGAILRSDFLISFKTADSSSSDSSSVSSTSMKVG